MARIFIYIVFILLISGISCFENNDDIVRIFSYNSESLNEKVVFYAFIPQTSKTPVPVLYFLNDTRQVDADPNSYVNFQKYANIHCMIIVILGAGDYIYINNQGLDDVDIEDYVLEVVNIIDDTYITKQNKLQRGIMGIGIGGAGALSIAKNNPQYFTSISSISGNFTGYKFEDIYTLNGCNILISVPVNDKNISENRDFHQYLSDNEIDHRYEENPGRDNWEYWMGKIIEHFEYHANNFINNKE